MSAQKNGRMDVSRISTLPNLIDGKCMYACIHACLFILRSMRSHLIFILYVGVLRSCLTSPARTYLSQARWSPRSSSTGCRTDSSEKRRFAKMYVLFVCMHVLYVCIYIIVWMSLYILHLGRNRRVLTVCFWDPISVLLSCIVSLKYCIYIYVCVCVCVCVGHRETFLRGPVLVCGSSFSSCFSIQECVDGSSDGG